jgi:hypothetical protein
MYKPAGQHIWMKRFTGCRHKTQVQKYIGLSLLCAAARQVVDLCV